MSIKKFSDCLVIDVNKSEDNYTFNILCVNKMIRDVEISEDAPQKTRERMLRQLKNANRLNEFLNLTIEEVVLEHDSSTKTFIKNIS